MNINFNDNYSEIAKMIDHALLAPKMTDQEIDQGCRLAIKYATASVCVKPYGVKLAAGLLRGSGVKTGTVIGFPHGANDPSIKAEEAARALADGAEELDMVVNIGKVLSGDWDYVQKDIDGVVRVGHKGGAMVKVIFENCYLKDDQKIRLCQICARAGADFVKTSTGFADSGATVEDIKLMRTHSPAHIQIKASGGIRTFDQLLAFKEAGASRIGTSSTVQILEACKTKNK
jgi:deoxyribose-phosphate aldolase